MVRDKKDAACLLRSVVKTEDRPKEFVLVYLFYDHHASASTSTTIAVFRITYAHVQVKLQKNSYSRLLLCRYLMMFVGHKYSGTFQCRY